MRNRDLINTTLQSDIVSEKTKPKKMWEVSSPFLKVDSLDIFKKKNKPQIIKDYNLSLNIKQIESRTISIDIDSNFPWGAMFLITVDREYYFKGENAVYSGEIYCGDRIAGEHLLSEIIVEINDTDWYNKAHLLLKEYSKKITNISKISDNIEIKVLFSPLRPQAQCVLDIVGKDGEFIKGKYAETNSPNQYYNNTFITMTVRKTIKIPFEIPDKIGQLK